MTLPQHYNCRCRVIPLRESPNLRALIDRDLAIMILTSPIWIAGFLCLIVAGAVNDWRSPPRRS